MEHLDYLLAGALGLALAACSGFRVFVPLLAASLAYRTGYLTPSAGFAWLGTWPAVAVLGTATVAEILGYYLPVVDNVLDTITGPAAFLAGTILMTSALPDMPPVLRWGLGVLVGGGTAGIIQTGTSLLRAGSTVTTAGLGNPVLATVENLLALVGTALGLLLPLLVAALAVGMVVWVLVRLRRWRQRRTARRAQLAAGGLE
ncbi:DUF4126 domain-containing protein [Hymenobacter glacieicola]|uniref:DUF4126 domain-containing protein n=1 Tax=Hymenobacter glacieicola TaxID=1562124 RepID=A0ABQ1WZR5_9BACT|nr:DUF4126 domain-containing protein [Hymenobacter glacieicola]GGG48234.1 hypothetical protein GCM10011378_25480 [Hymenobacter glacieicola]